MKLWPVVTAIIGLVVGVVIGGKLIGGGGAPSVTETAGEGGASSSGGPAPAAPVRWKMASAFGSQWPIQGELGLRLVERLDVISEGSIKIQFFEPGALVPALEIFDAVSSGAIDAGWTTAGYWAGKVPALQFYTAVPFGPDAMEYAAWLYYAGGDVLYDQIYEPFNIKALHCGVHSPEASGWFREEIKSLDDLKGLKMRFFALGARVMEKLGVSTQLLAGGDIFPALELGTIDATEYASPAIDMGLGFYQIAKHYYFPGWHQQSTWVDVIFNLDKWNALSPRQQVLLTTACGDSVRESIAMGEARQVPAIAFLKEKGVQFHLWPQEILDAYSAAWDVVVAEEVAKDADFARAWESLKAFRESYSTWKELGYLK